MIRAFLDANIILDFLTNRELFGKEAALLFENVQKQKLKAFTSSNSIANIHYILNDLSKQRNVRQVLVDVRKFLDLVPTDEEILDRALASDFHDFEDAIQYYSAVRCDADFIVTRNKQDYKKSKIRLLDAQEMNRILATGGK